MSIDSFPSSRPSFYFEMLKYSFICNFSTYCYYCIYWYLNSAVDLTQLWKLIRERLRFSSSSNFPPGLPGARLQLGFPTNYPCKCMHYDYVWQQLRWSMSCDRAVHFAGEHWEVFTPGQGTGAIAWHRPRLRRNKKVSSLLCNFAN